LESSTGDLTNHFRRHGRNVAGVGRIAIFARRYIAPGEELSYDYNFQSFGEMKKCSCGAKNCRGFLGMNKRKEVDEVSTPGMCTGDGDVGMDDVDVEAMANSAALMEMVASSAAAAAAKRRSVADSLGREFWVGVHRKFRFPVLDTTWRTLQKHGHVFQNWGIFLCRNAGRVILAEAAHWGLAHPASGIQTSSRRAVASRSRDLPTASGEFVAHMQRLQAASKDAKEREAVSISRGNGCLPNDPYTRDTPMNRLIGRLWRRGGRDLPPGARLRSSLEDVAGA
jgi:hypothetical protein